MKRYTDKRIFRIFFFAFVLCSGLCVRAHAQDIPVDAAPSPQSPEESLEERLQRKITLDVRDMSVTDVIKFLALKGDFNVVITSAIQGRATFYLKSVSIQDALDIAILSNRLAYLIQNNIVRVMAEEEYVQLYGKTFSDRRQVRIVHLDYAKPSYVFATLEGVKSDIGQIIIDEDTGTVVLIDTPESLERMANVISGIEKPLEIFTYNLKYAKAPIIADQLRSKLDAHTVGSVSADERSNQLVVRAFPGRRKEVEKLIKELDTKTKEVLIEARILQVTFNPEYDMGIDWQLDFKANPDKQIRKLSFNNVLLNASGLPISDNLSTSFGQIAIGDIDVDHFELTLRALKQVSDTKILSNPKILVTDNEEAQIHIGDTIPYIISTTSGTGENAITSEDVRFTDVGIKFIVTPTINDDGFVTMRLKPEISTVSGFVESQGGGIPQVNKTVVETTVMVRDGATIILAGLNKDDKTHIQKGVPLLMDIPILGKFFTRTTDTITKTETVIFITPHIVSGGEHFTGMKGGIKPSKSYRNEISKGE
jgi:type II secretory pathway component GspD/PulD (secretin)